MAYNAAKLKDEGLPHSKEAAMAKLFASEMANDAAGDDGDGGIITEQFLEAKPLFHGKLVEGIGHVLDTLCLNTGARGIDPYLAFRVGDVLDQRNDLQSATSFSALNRDGIVSGRIRMWALSVCSSTNVEK